MAMTLTSSTRTVTLPNYAREGLAELITQNFSKNVTLSGKMYVDFLNVRGGWKVKFDVIDRSEYANLWAIYNDQFDNEEFLTLNDPDIPVTSLSVFMSMPSERNLSWAKSVTKDLYITLEAENAN